MISEMDPDGSIKKMMQEIGDPEKLNKILSEIDPDGSVKKMVESLGDEGRLDELLADPALKARVQKALNGGSEGGVNLGAGLGQGSRL